jgi:hypothetical protein
MLALPFDQRLANLKLEDLSLEIQRKIAADEGHIRAIRNGNVATPPARRLEMQIQRTDEWADEIRNIYLDTWQKQGNQKSPEFIRIVLVNAVVELIRTRMATVMGQSALVRQQTRSLQDMLNLDEFARRMLQLEAKWKRRLEIDATECEYAYNKMKLAAGLGAQKSSPDKAVDFISRGDKWGKVFDQLREWGGRMALLKSCITAVWRWFSTGVPM